MSVAEVLPFAPMPLQQSQSMLSVLVVEDDRKMRERLVGQLAAFGINPEVAPTGFAAIKIAAQVRPNLILLDALLPEMHGFEVARFIRKIDTSYRPHIAVVTAIYKNVRYHNEARLKYGIDDYLIKPATDAAIAAIVNKVDVQVNR